MTDERDFDRISRAWLDLMPSEAPDRTVAAVLQAVETAPQVRRPWRRLPWRSSPMTRFSLAIGAAALAIVVVSSLMLTRPPSPSVVGTTPSPASSASPSASASAPVVPTELRARWMGGHRDFVQLNKGSNLVFTGGQFVMTESNQWDSVEFLSSKASAVGDGQLRLELTADDNGCQKGDVGLYAWSLTPSGHTLTITADQDDCAARSSALPGVWWLAGCPNELCLGILDAGTYKSQYIVPRLDPGAAWEPEFGALTYTVPEGWANSNDSPESYELVPAPEMPPVAETDRRRNIGIFTQPTAMTQDKPCSDKVQPGVGRTVSALSTWLQTVPGLIATAPKSITIDGHPGQWLDLRRDPSWTKTCDGSTEPLVTFLNPGIAVGADQRVRLILLDLGGGDVVATGVWTRDQATLDAFIPEAMPVIESFHYE
jgi:hypothetical protein